MLGERQKEVFFKWAAEVSFRLYLHVLSFSR